MGFEVLPPSLPWVQGTGFVGYQFLYPGVHGDRTEKPNPHVVLTPHSLTPTLFGTEGPLTSL